MKALREEEAVKTEVLIDDTKDFARGLVGLDGKQGFSNSLQTVSNGADVVTGAALLVPGVGEPAAAVAATVSTVTGTVSGLLSTNEIKNMTPIAAGELAVRVSSELGVGGKVAIGVGMAVQKEVESVISP